MYNRSKRCGNYYKLMDIADGDLCEIWTLRMTSNLEMMCYTFGGKCVFGVVFKVTNVYA